MCHRTLQCRVFVRVRVGERDRKKQREEERGGERVKGIVIDSDILNLTSFLLACVLPEMIYRSPSSDCTFVVS